MSASEQRFYISGAVAVTSREVNIPFLCHQGYFSKPQMDFRLWWLWIPIKMGSDGVDAPPSRVAPPPKIRRSAFRMAMLAATTRIRGRSRRATARGVRECYPCSLMRANRAHALNFLRDASEFWPCLPDPAGPVSPGARALTAAIRSTQATEQFRLQPMRQAWLAAFSLGLLNRHGRTG
jgi:hypothetical protein